MKSAYVLLLICTLSTAAFAQRPQGTKNNSAAGLPLSERLFFGGGGSFGSGYYAGFKYNYFMLSPLVGYRVTMPWAIGAQVMYQNMSFPTQNVKLVQYGLSPFTQYRFGKLFAHAEYQMISIPRIDKSSRTVYDRLPIGLGFTQPIGGKAAINAIALYDVMYTKANPTFSSPWIFRVYFTLGGLSF